MEKQKIEPSIALGMALREAREKRGLSKRAFSLLSGINATRGLAMERGKRLTPENVAMFAAALNTTPKALVSRAQEICKGA